MSADTASNFEGEQKFAGDTWMIGSKVSEVTDADMATEKKLASLGFNDEDVFQFGVAVREASLNALLHGNLQIPSKVGYPGGESAYEEEINNREQSATYSSKKIIYAWTFDASKGEIKVSISDEGPGFDPDKVEIPNLEKNEGLMEVGKRGILLIKSLCDDVQFSPDGRTITLTKKKAVEK